MMALRVHRTFLTAVGEKARLVFVGADPVHARQLHVVHPRGNAERMDHRRAGEHEDRGPRIGGAEEIGEQQRAADVAEAEGIVRVEEDLRGAPATRPDVRARG
jgi:hypothetical protein